MCNIVLKWNEVTFRRYGKCLEEMAVSDCRLLGEFFVNYVQVGRGSNTCKLEGVEYTNPKLNP